MNTVQDLRLREDVLERLAAAIMSVHDGARNVFWKDGENRYDELPEDEKEYFREIAAQTLVFVTEDTE